jgi:hypothetical protein
MPPRHHRQSGLSIATWPTLLSATAQALTVGAVLAGCRLFTALGERAAAPRAGRRQAASGRRRRQAEARLRHHSLL